MCSPCCVICCGGCQDCCTDCCCGGCCTNLCCGGCCPTGVRATQTLQFPSEHRWFERCTNANCVSCQDTTTTNECSCICRRNRHIIEALTCLFNTTIPHMVSTLFKLVVQQNEPLKRFPRDRKWDVMEHVKAPYTELNDLEIYDSMYDRCGLPIEPLHSDNIYKIVRLMFLAKVLTLEQQKYLLRMLKRLNQHAHCPVDLYLLLQTLENVNVKELMCSIHRQEEFVRSLHTARQCHKLCDLYNQVVTVDKRSVQRHRRRLRYGNKNHLKATMMEKQPSDESAAVRQSQLQRQYCDRKADLVSTAASPNGTTTSSVGRTRYAGSRNPSRSSK
ncbi:uncharacterized protein LOC132795687 [Drosophila nasuta]|uniref:uncharacterized protein LOC132795687 n=1 Tax=Drosophila nasuta TaxID=42062 RepID=UPI00295E59F6|nr:uncharacterized protein LOC132795687 [Drosophila nasuta]